MPELNRGSGPFTPTPSSVPADTGIWAIVVLVSPSAKVRSSVRAISVNWFAAGPDAKSMSRAVPALLSAWKVHDVITPPPGGTAYGAAPGADAIWKSAQRVQPPFTGTLPGATCPSDVAAAAGSAGSAGGPAGS